MYNYSGARFPQYIDQTEDEYLDSRDNIGSYTSNEKDPIKSRLFSISNINLIQDIITGYIFYTYKLEIPFQNESDIFEALELSYNYLLHDASSLKYQKTANILRRVLMGDDAYIPIQKGEIKSIYGNGDLESFIDMCNKRAIDNLVIAIEYFFYRCC